MMRIITGTARGTSLLTLEGETTRPTAERTKEAIFSMLQFEIGDRSVLDLFGGSGQMALEALSRGASRAYIADADRDAYEIIKKNARKTRLFEKTRIVCSDFRSVLRDLAGKEKFDLVFLDPPYRSGYMEDALAGLTKGELVADGGCVICESDADTPFAAPGFTLYRHNKYGRAYVTVLRKNASPEKEN